MQLLSIAKAQGGVAMCLRGQVFPVQILYPGMHLLDAEVKENIEEAPVLMCFPPDHL